MTGFIGHITNGDSEGDLRECQHQLKLLAEALGTVLVSSKTIADRPMTGPELLAHAGTLALSLDTGELKLRLTDYSTDDLVAELSRREEISPEHEVRIAEGRFGIKHPWRCRADLIGCELNQYMENWPEGLTTLSPGKYVATKRSDMWVFALVGHADL